MVFKLHATSLWLHAVLATFDTLLASHSTVLRAYDDTTELVRRGLLMRIGQGNNEKLSEFDTRLSSLAKEYPLFFGSKTILELLSKRHLITVSESSGLVAFQAIIVGLFEDKIS